MATKTPTQGLPPSQYAVFQTWEKMSGNSETSSLVIWEARGLYNQCLHKRFVSVVDTKFLLKLAKSVEGAASQVSDSHASNTSVYKVAREIHQFVTRLQLQLNHLQNTLITANTLKGKAAEASDLKIPLHPETVRMCLQFPTGEEHGASIEGNMSRIRYVKLPGHKQGYCVQKEVKPTKVPEIPHKEATIAAMLGAHPNIVRLFYHRTNEEGCEVNYFEAGAGSLSNAVNNPAVLSCIIQDLKSFVRDLLSAFAHMESVGVVHDDVKLDNLIFKAVDIFEESPRRMFRAKVIDFGTSVPKGYVSGNGSKFYISPQKAKVRLASKEEGLEHSATSKDDSWSLGVTIYKLLMGGHSPFRESTIATRNERKREQMQFILDCTQEEIETHLIQLAKKYATSENVRAIIPILRDLLQVKEESRLTPTEALCKHFLPRSKL